MSNTIKYFQYAQEVSKKIGWLPEVIYTQWQVETAHFTSKNFKKNNNIAGQHGIQAYLLVAEEQLDLKMKEGII
ncbi:hypothetical protein V5E38_06990 [Rossellomorea sp. GAMAL-10_SWC]